MEKYENESIVIDERLEEIGGKIDEIREEALDGLYKAKSVEELVNVQSSFKIQYDKYMKEMDIYEQELKEGKYGDDMHTIESLMVIKMMKAICKYHVGE